VYRLCGSALTGVLVLTAGGCSPPADRHRVATNAPTTSRPVRSSAAITQPSPTPSGARTVTVLGSGDVLIHPPLWQQAAADARAQGRSGYDFGPIYAGIAPVTGAAGLAICELETPLAAPGGPFAGWPNFNAPPQVLTALKAAGYDSCTTASNHTLDQGYAGVKRTLDELDAAGLRHTGSARSAAEAAEPLILTTGNGIRVAQLAFSFGFNGIEVPAGQPWLANSIDLPAILAAAHRAKHAGADIVVLSMHWGVEYDHHPSAEQTGQADRLLASPDIDVILGDHAHVVQPFEKLHGKWVAYCMGNQIARHAVPLDESREGVMARFTFTEVAPHRFVTTRAEAIPTWMELSPRLRLIQLGPAIADPQTATGTRAGYRSAVTRITGYLDLLGARRDGLIIG
jgi:poly-gamma-glutamate synthesis protein (capsule biosynthesis protein)